MFVEPPEDLLQVQSIALDDVSQILHHLAGLVIDALLSVDTLGSQTVSLGHLCNRLFYLHGLHQPRPIRIQLVEHVLRLLLTDLGVYHGDQFAELLPSESSLVTNVILGHQGQDVDVALLDAFVEHLQDLHGLLFLERVLVELVGRVVQFYYVVLELLEADALVPIDVEFLDS